MSNSINLDADLYCPVKDEYMPLVATFDGFKVLLVTTAPHVAKAVVQELIALEVAEAGWWQVVSIGRHGLVALAEAIKVDHLAVAVTSDSVYLLPIGWLHPAKVFEAEGVRRISSVFPSKRKGK